MDPNELPQDFREFFELLNSESVEYLLVGGYAVGVHGYVRTTGDIDAWVAANPSNAARLATALRRFGFSTDAVRDSMFDRPGKVFQIGVPPMRIDILTEVSGLEFTDAYDDRELHDLGGVTVPVISLADLRVNKRASGRNKDLADLDNLPE